MKGLYPRLSIIKLCGWFGLSKQAYYQHQSRRIKRAKQEELVLQQVHLLRRDHPKMGVRKLHQELGMFLSSHGIKLGRDGLFDLLSAHNLLIKRRKRSAKTTQSYHHYRKHPNLIQGFEATAPNQLWVSDLTYWRVEEGFYYISLITDAYSRKIVGYHVGESLEVVESLSALKMALSTRKRWERDRTESPEVIKRVQGVQGVQGGEPIGLIHHSDRGIQYCSTKYVKLLEKNGIAISMTQSGDPLDNALAERVNGILKGEYLEELRVSNLRQAKSYLRKKIGLYNAHRPHMSISGLTPDYVYGTGVRVSRKWKNYYRIVP